MTRTCSSAMYSFLVLSTLVSSLPVDLQSAHVTLIGQVHVNLISGSCMESDITSGVDAGHLDFFSFLISGHLSLISVLSG